MNHQPRRPPVLLVDVAVRCRAVGKNLQIYRVEASTIFRVSVGGQEIRVAVTLPSYPRPDLGNDPNSPLHHAESLAGLDVFLDQFTESELLPFGPSYSEL